MSRQVMIATCTLALLCTPTLHAQFSEVTEEDIKSVPEPFRPSARTGPNFAGFAPRGTPAGYTPNSDPRDFSGSYITGGGGGPPSGGGAPGGAGRPGGGAPGGAGPPDGGARGPGVGPQGVNASGAGSTCLPSFGGGAYPTHIVSSPTALFVVGEENHRVRRIVVGSRHAGVGASYGGDSIARWQGNTLVVETIDINGRTGTLLERWTKQADGSLQVISTTVAADGKYSASEQTSRYTWRPDLQFLENICEDYGEAFTQGYGGK
jgi:hypothetical protein